MDSESAVETLVPVYQTKRPHIQKDWHIGIVTAEEYFVFEQWYGGQNYSSCDISSAGVVSVAMISSYI
jgi:hypothetical protein